MLCPVRKDLGFELIGSLAKCHLVKHLPKFTCPVVGLVGCVKWYPDQALCRPQPEDPGTAQRDADELELMPMLLFLVAKSCPTFCDPMDCGPPGSSVHGTSQVRILEWVVISFSRGSS